MHTQADTSTQIRLRAHFSVNQLNYTFPFVLLLSIAESASDSLLNTVIMFSQRKPNLPIFMFSCRIGREHTYIAVEIHIKAVISSNSNSNNRIHAHTETMHSDDISMLNELNTTQRKHERSCM